MRIALLLAGTAATIYLVLLGVAFAAMHAEYLYDETETP